MAEKQRKGKEDIMSSQDKKGSLIESVIQVVTGWLTAILTQLIVYPLMGIEVSISQNIWISMIFIAIGFIKQYYVRRGFEIYYK